MLSTFGVITHLVLDLFQAPTPLLWPLLNESLMDSVKLDLRIGSSPTVAGYTRLLTGEGAIRLFSSFDGPVLTAEGLGVSPVLLAPAIVTTLWGRRKKETKKLRTQQQDQVT
jgi:hypothetical protein